ncbi:MAG: RNA polymerase sigma factor [Polyangiales bacterium]
MKRTTPLDGLVDDLNREICARKPALRRFGLSDADADDIHQDLLLRVGHKLGEARPRDLGAYVASALRNAAHDLMRARQRHPSISTDADEFARAIDALELHASAAETSLRERGWMQLQRDLEIYEARANLGRYRRGQQVRAWWCVRIEGDDAAEIAAVLGAPSAQAVWQWCNRGAALVLELAAKDNDRARAERMIAAVDAARRAA